MELAPRLHELVEPRLSLGVGDEVARGWLQFGAT
jgi:hypothetical protein